MTSINWSNVTDFQGILAGANTNTGSWFWTLINFGIWIIIMILFSGYGWSATLLISSFVALIFGVILSYSGLMSWSWVLVFLGTILTTIFYIVWVAKKEV